MRENKFSCLSRGVSFVDDVAVFVERDVRLSYDMFVLNPRRQIKRKRFIARLLAARTDAFVRFIDIVLRHMIARLELCAAAVPDAHKFDHAAIDDFAIRRFDEAKLVDASVARQRRNQTDVRTLRRLDRTDAPIVCRVHVADFESGTLAAQSARSQRRQPALVCNF